MSAITPQYTHLYELWCSCWDSCDLGPHECYEVRSRLVTRVTAKRIYFASRSHPVTGRVVREGFVDRATIEAAGEVWHRRVGAGGTRLYLSPPPLPTRPRNDSPSVADLRASAAAVHPDRGGDPGEFRRRYAAYANAKRRAG